MAGLIKQLTKTRIKIDNIFTAEADASTVIVEALSLDREYKTTASVGVKPSDNGLYYVNAQPIELDVIYLDRFRFDIVIVTSDNRRSVVQSFEKSFKDYASSVSVGIWYEHNQFKLTATTSNTNISHFEWIHWSGNTAPDFLPSGTNPTDDTPYNVRTETKEFHSNCLPATTHYVFCRVVLIDGKYSQWSSKYSFTVYSEPKNKNLFRNGRGKGNVFSLLTPKADVAAYPATSGTSSYYVIGDYDYNRYQTIVYQCIPLPEPTKLDEYYSFSFSCRMKNSASNLNVLNFAFALTDTKITPTEAELDNYQTTYGPSIVSQRDFYNDAITTSFKTFKVDQVFRISSSYQNKLFLTIFIDFQRTADDENIYLTDMCLNQGYRGIDFVYNEEDRTEEREIGKAAHIVNQLLEIDVSGRVRLKSALYAAGLSTVPIINTAGAVDTSSKGSNASSTVPQYTNYE